MASASKNPAASDTAEPRSKAAAARPPASAAASSAHAEPAPAADAEGLPPSLPPEPPADPMAWSRIWQMPVLLLGLGLICLGVYLWLLQAKAPEPENFPRELTAVQQHLSANDLEGAKTILEGLEKRIERGTGADRATYALCWGDLFAQQIEQQPTFESAENRQKILEWYNQAQQGGQAFDGLHLQRWAEAHVALGQEEEARKIVVQLKDEPAQRRYAILKQLIQRRLSDPRANVTQATPLFEQFLDELRNEVPAKRRIEEIWAWGALAEGMLNAGQAAAVVTALLPKIARLSDGPNDADLVPLKVLLAGAFYQIGDFKQAEQEYLAVQKKLLASDKLNAEVLVGLARLDLLRAGEARAGDLDGVRLALEKFTRAEVEYPTAGVYLEALIGRADCEARRGAHAEAVEHFGQAIKKLRDHPRPAAARVEALDGVIFGHYMAASDAGRYGEALDHLNLLVPLHQPQLPPRLLAHLALTHERLGQEKMAEAATTASAAAAEEIPTTQPNAARKLALQEASGHFAHAGDYYLQHAQSQTVPDEQGAGASLWSAAACYERAKLWKKAVDVYAQFVRTRPSDPRQLEATKRLGLAYQADGQHAVAAELFERLVGNHPSSREADECLVPLARCQIALNQPAAAKRLLEHVLKDNASITPESLPYRLALTELGKLHYRLGEFEAAAQRLEEAVQRYGGTGDGPVLRFALADTYRQSIPELDRTLTESLPQNKRQALMAERARRLREAQDLYGKSVGQYESFDPAALSDLDRLYLRNAYFYRADCAYDLRNFEEARSLYDKAANRWKNHPAALVALVQIVNAYCEEGKFQEARAVNQRARALLTSLPDEVFRDPSLPMSRKHWQDWLQWTSQAELFGETTGAPVAAQP